MPSLTSRLNIRASRVNRMVPRTSPRLARETFRFTHDVREGMELYMARHSVPAGSTLSTDRDAQPKDGH